MLPPFPRPFAKSRRHESSGLKGMTADGARTPPALDGNACHNRQHTQAGQAQNSIGQYGGSPHEDEADAGSA